MILKGKISCKYAYNLIENIILAAIEYEVESGFHPHP